MSSEKTEQPTPGRLRKAREDGQVAKSRDFTQILLMVALIGWSLSQFGSIMSTFGELLSMPGRLYGLQFRESMPILVAMSVRISIELLLPYLLIVLVVGVFSEAIQTGGLISFKALLPRGDRLNPVNNAQQMFAMKNFIEFFKNCLKVVVLSVIVYLVVRDSLAPLVKVPSAGLGAAGLALGEMMRVLAVQTAVVFGAIALADLVWQRHQYVKGLMMSMDEIKQEYKQMEGDPHMKGHRKELAREIAMGDGVEQTRKSSVVVANPTHLSVALLYKQGETPLPMVMAKGAGAVALAMREAAREEGIPVVHNIPLARALMKKVRVGEYIPTELLEPVADLLLTVRRLEQERLMETIDE